MDIKSCSVAVPRFGPYCSSHRRGPHEDRPYCRVLSAHIGRFRPQRLSRRLLRRVRLPPRTLRWDHGQERRLFLERSDLLVVVAANIAWRPLPCLSPYARHNAGLSDLHHARRNVI